MSLTTGETSIAMAATKLAEIIYSTYGPKLYASDLFKSPAVKSFVVCQLTQLIPRLASVYLKLRWDILNPLTSDEVVIDFNETVGDQLFDKMDPTGPYYDPGRSALISLFL